MIIERIAQHFAPSFSYRRDEFRANVLAVGATLDEVRPYLAAPAGKPYGRKLVYCHDSIEVIVMNWNPGEPCLPHDHGESEGWVQVLSGAVEHTLCRQSGQGMPQPAHSEIETEQSLFFAPRGLIHVMRSLPSEPRTVTLHFYSPPITGMRVFDLENNAACVVSDDCGAWWPEPEKLVRRLPVGGRDGAEWPTSASSLAVE